MSGAVAAPAAAHRHRHTPRVRRLAAEHGVDLAALAGSGPAGRVTRDDVLRAAEPSRSAPSPASAPLTSVVEVDVTATLALCERRAPDLLDRLGLRLTLTAFVARAAVEALGGPPFRQARVHLGIAVDTERGTAVPVVRDAGELNLLGLAGRIQDVTGRARDGALGPDEAAGGSFTLTDPGSRGTLWDTPVLVAGQAAALGTGAVVERPVVLRRPDGERVIGIRSMALLALTHDPRLVDGAGAARFLTAVRARLEAGRFDDDLA